MEGPGEGYTERQFRAHVSLYKMLGCTGQIKNEESAGLEGVAALTRLFQHVCSRGSDEGERREQTTFTVWTTVLSTNWFDVGKRRVEIDPSDEMEWKENICPSPGSHQ
jgi:suppressor of G2 allele of SKP1